MEGSASSPGPPFDPATQPGASGSSSNLTSGTPRAVPVSWPPPGLEGIQGALGLAVVYLGLGGLILVFPLLWSVGREYPFYSLGPFGDAWWVLLFSSFLGLLPVLVGLEVLFRFFRVGRKAVLNGIPAGAVVKVGADGERDMGFLLQGARAFSALSPDVRRRTAQARVWGVGLYLAGALWMLLGFFLSVFLAGRGGLAPAGMWLLTLGPVGLFLLAGLMARGMEGSYRRRALRGRSQDPWKDPELRASAASWWERARERTPLGEEVTGRGGFVTGIVGVLVLAVLIGVPTFTLALTNTVGPVLAQVAVPRFGVTQERAARAEVFRPLRLRGDPTVTPLEAGEALQSLLFVGGGPVDELFRVPPRRYEPDFSADPTPESLALTGEGWKEGLFSRAREGLTDEERTFLDSMAAHPALAEFAVLSRARALDALGARYRLPFPEGTTSMALPLPRFSRAREGGRAMVARAALEVDGGLEAEAEGTLREVVSAGFLMLDEGPTLIDNLIGSVLVREGGDGLEALYRITGQEEKAGAIAASREIAERAMNVSGALADWQGSEEALASMPEAVTGPGTVRGLRWEFFLVLNGLSPCLNAHKVVFGPDRDMEIFIEEAREVLVRYPSEAALFDLMREGWFGAGDGGQRWLGRLVGLTLGGTERPGSCARLLATINW